MCSGGGVGLLDPYKHVHTICSLVSSVVGNSMAFEPFNFLSEIFLHELPVPTSQHTPCAFVTCPECYENCKYKVYVTT